MLMPGRAALSRKVPIEICERPRDDPFSIIEPGTKLRVSLVDLSEPRSDALAYCLLSYHTLVNTSWQRP